MLLTPVVMMVMLTAQADCPAEICAKPSPCCAASCEMDKAGEITIVAFGDSTTAPRGPLKVYAGLIETDLRKKGIPARVINAGVGGNTTAMARKRFAKDVLARNPRLAIISFGINDSAVDVWKDATTPRVSIEDYASNLRYFVEQLRKNGSEVVFFTPNPLAWTPKLKDLYGKPPYDPDTNAGFNRLLDRYAETMRNVAKETDTPLVDLRKAFEKRAAETGIDELLLDGMHPNDTAHRLIADRLLERIVPLLKKGNCPREQ